VDRCRLVNKAQWFDPGATQVTAVNRVELERSRSDRFADLLPRLAYRRADSSAERDAIGRLRYQAYRRDGTIAPNAAATFVDADDVSDNGYVFGVFVDGELASSLRLHVATRGTPSCPSLGVFPDYIGPELNAGKVIIDSTRFVADERLSRMYRGLPYVTLRPCVLAAEYFGADQLLAAVRMEHCAFYRRAFGHRMVCGPRHYPKLEKPICLMTVHFRTIADDLYRRYPFFRSTAAEQRKFFERLSSPLSAAICEDDRLRA
jgi:hypothetical protein